MIFGAFVVNRDNEVIGAVERVVLDLTTNEVLEFIVHKTAGVAKNVDRDVVVPASVVSEVNDALVLNLGPSDIDKFPDYVAAIRGLETTLQNAGPSLLNETVEISNRTKVECVDGEIGALYGVVIDGFTMEATDILVSLKDRSRNVTIPMAWAASLHSNRIRLQCSQREI